METTQQRGYLILIGGAEDKKKDKVVLKKVIETSKATNIIIVPSASYYPREVANNYFDAFKDLGVEKVDYFDIRYPDEADRTEHLERIEEANLVYFSGGDQVKLAQVLLGTKLLARINELFLNGKITIAGTSAGSAVASNPMIFDGDYDGFSKDTVNFAQGFGFLPDVTIDTHFIARGRISRLAQFLASGRSNRGIGIDEDTSIFIAPNFNFEVVGSGMVTLLTNDRVTYNDYDQVEKGKLFSINNLRIGFLSNGQKFSIKKWAMIKPLGIKKKIIDFVENPFTDN